MGTEGGMREGTWRDPRGMVEGTEFLLDSSLGNEVGLCCVSCASVLESHQARRKRGGIQEGKFAPA